MEHEVYQRYFFAILAEMRRDDTAVIKLAAELATYQALFADWGDDIQKEALELYRELVIAEIGGVETEWS